MKQHEHQHLLEAVLSSAIDGILVIDAAGIIKMVNSAAADLFQYEEKEMIGQNVSMLMGGDHARAHDGYINRYLKFGDARIIGIGREVEGRRKDGSSFPFRLAVGEITLPDRTLFTGVIHDRSAEHEYEQRLSDLNTSLEQRVKDRTLALEDALAQLQLEIQERRKAEKFAAQSREEALRSLERERELGELKSRFVSLASHEFRTPLSTILSSVELLKRYTETEQQDRRERHIERIRNSVTHLTDVLNDFLSLGRMDEGRLSSSIEPIDLDALIAEFVDYISPTLKPGQRIEFKARLGKSPFYSDGRFLRNILNNLVSNASKYSGLDAIIHLTATRSDESLKIVVSDSGMGIPKDVQGQVFSRFFRAQNAENIQGTGLGLHIVSRYLKLLGGSISFESEEGRGTTFEVLVPDGASAKPGQ